MHADRVLGLCLLLVSGIAPLSGGCWLGRDLTVCDSDDDCVFTQRCVSNRCVTRDEYTRCTETGDPVCPPDTACRVAVAACLPLDGGDGGDDSDAGPDLEPDAPVDGDAPGEDTDLTDDVDVAEDPTVDLDVADLDVADLDVAADAAADVADPDVAADVATDAATDVDADTAPGDGGDPDVGTPDADVDIALDPPADNALDTADAPDLGTPPPAPTGVNATNGTTPGFVTITWNAAVRADSYRVLRDGFEIATGILGTSHDDTGANARAPSATGLSVAATLGIDPDIVTLTWSEPIVPAGMSHSYTVVAENAAGLSPASAADPGFRAGPPVTGYDVRVGGVDPWIPVGDVLTWDDLNAPAGTLNSAGTAIAGDAASVFGVPLNLTGVSVSAGAIVGYQVRAVNSVGPGTSSPSASGRRAAPLLTYQWQRSADETAGAYADIVGATSAVWEDRAGPIDESVRWYRCVVSDGVSSLGSGPNDGRRKGSVIVRANSNFGRGLALNDTFALISSPSTGFFYVFSDGGWVFDSMLSSPGGGAHAVALTESRALLTLPEANGFQGTGSVYTFGGSGWDLEDTFGPEECLCTIEAGATSALQDDVAVLGASASDLDPTLYLYWRSGTTWGSETAISTSDLGLPTSAKIGSDLSLSGSRLAVVAGSGDAAWILELPSPGIWSLDDEIVAADVGPLGSSIDIDGDLVVVGARNDDCGGTNSGSAYVFRRAPTGEWEEEDELCVPGTNQFGNHVAIAGNRVAISAGGSGPPSLCATRPVLVYEYDGTWSERASICVPEAVADIELSDEWLSVGMPAGSSGGTVLLFYVGD